MQTEVVRFLGDHGVATIFTILEQLEQKTGLLTQTENTTFKNDSDGCCGFLKTNFCRITTDENGDIDELGEVSHRGKAELV